ncbi:MAG TPA: endonuclease VII domain-containing protein [Anaerolineales bacterium]|nr:endonuclease VII domain-containing protein [Anaerolineales bacterium]
MEKHESTKFDNKLYSKKYYWRMKKENPEKLREQWRKRQAKPEYSEYQKKWKVENRNKVLEYSREWRKNNPELAQLASLKSRLMAQYSLSMDSYNKMLEDQAGLCALCGNPEHVKDPRTGSVKRLSVDHNHTTKKVRKLLCADCNHMIGYSREKPEILRKAAEYLEDYE